jgi:hypothetical protein
VPEGCAESSLRDISGFSICSTSYSVSPSIMVGGGGATVEVPGEAGLSNEIWNKRSAQAAALPAVKAAIRKRRHK